VDEAIVSRSSGHVELDEAAVAAVRRTKFEPGTREGKPAATWVRVPVIFSLQ
jgi:protein TonB